MAKERLFRRLLRNVNPSRSTPLSFNDWAQLIQNPLLQTSWSAGPDIEEVMNHLGGAVEANGPTFALVLARAMVFSEARFVWRRFVDGRPQRPFGTNELSILEQPWHGGTTGNLLTKMEFDASRAGNAYIRRLDGYLNMLRPEWVTIVLVSDEEPNLPVEAADMRLFGYIYEPPNASPVALLPEEVAHYAPIPHPEFRFLGMSWITPVIEDVVGDQAGTVHKNQFFRQAATPNMVVSFPKEMKKDKVIEFGKLLDARHAGEENAYKTMYLGGGADAKVVGSSFKEIDFSVTQGKGESRLASAAGVPPSWVGFSEGLQGSSLNQGNFTAARRRFADGTMRPLWREACASLQTILIPPQGAHLWYDEKDIPFLREDKSTAATIMAQEASLISMLIREGFKPKTVIEAVTNSDWNLLEHDERFISVQIQSLKKAQHIKTGNTDSSNDDDNSDESDEDKNGGKAKE